MFNYCTLFDSNYLTRGLGMYHSLIRNSPEAHLYIFAFDTLCASILNQLNLTHATIITLSEFETPQLLEIKKSRSAGEYCWTCTPSIIKHSIERYDLESCTYLDADLYFYSDPSVLIEEMGNKSVLISEHRYTKLFDHSKRAGVYCVQFMTFKNTDAGMTVLNWWQERCNEWCYNRYEDGKFGDQKYLDDWTTRFDCVHVMENEGGGVAPWNIQQYSIAKHEGSFTIENKKTGRKSSLIFYHFHKLQFHSKTFVYLGFYPFSIAFITNLYTDYIDVLLGLNADIKTIDASKSNYHGGSDRIIIDKVFKSFISKVLFNGSMRVNYLP